MENNFEILHILLACIKNSEIPEERLLFLKSLKELLNMGKRLNKLKPNEETENGIQKLKEQIKGYSLYPKLKNSLN